MACDKDSLGAYLSDFSGTRPLEAIYCAYAGDAGAGMGVTAFALFFFGFVGLALSIRVQHPGPVVVAGMLSMAAIAPTLPGQATMIVFIVLLFAIAALGLYMLQRVRASGGI